MNEDKPIPPWYKQFWPWFLISLPGSVVIAAMITINIAFTDADGLVKDDYYKEGLAMNQDLARKNMATSLGIKAEGQIDAAAGTASVALNDAAIGQVDTLLLKMIHPTRADNDMTLVLQRTQDSTFSGTLTDKVNPGYWWVRLEPENNTWYVQGRVRLPEDQRVVLE